MRSRVAARLDAEFAKDWRNCSGPLHGIVIAIKDQFDTFEHAPTSGADVAYCQRPSTHDATFAARLRAAVRIVLAKANMGEYAAVTRSSFAGTSVNAYDSERQPGGSSSGSGSAVAANFCHLRHSRGNRAVHSSSLPL